MKRPIPVILLISAFFTGMLYGSETTLAVLDFENNCIFNRDEYQPLSKGLSDMMISELSQIESIQVVERSRLQTILDEMKLAQSGLVSEQNSISVGKMLGAKHLVFGGYLVAGKDKIRVDMRIVEVETGLTLKAGEVTGKSKDVLTLIEKLSSKILSDLEVKLSKQEKKGLKNSSKLDMKAVMVFSKGIEFEDAGELKKAAQHYQQALKMEPKFEQAKTRLMTLIKKVKGS